MSRVYRYTVEGRGTFPLDMLRYDASYPAASDDATVIDQDRNEGTFYREIRSVTLIHNHVGRSRWEPTYARWESFSWKVIDNKELL